MQTINNEPKAPLTLYTIGKYQLGIITTYKWVTFRVNKKIEMFRIQTYSLKSQIQTMELKQMNRHKLVQPKIEICISVVRFQHNK